MNASANCNVFFPLSAVSDFVMLPFIQISCLAALAAAVNSLLESMRSYIHRADLSHVSCQQAVEELPKSELEACNLSVAQDSIALIDDNVVDSWAVQYVRVNGHINLKQVAHRCRVHRDWHSCPKEVLQEHLDGQHQMRCLSARKVIWIKNEEKPRLSEGICVYPEELRAIEAHGEHMRFEQRLAELSGRLDAGAKGWNKKGIKEEIKQITACLEFSPEDQATALREELKKGGALKLTFWKDGSSK